MSEPERVYSGKVLVRLPSTLHRDLAEAAEDEGVSLNQFVLGALAGAVQWRQQHTEEERRMARAHRATVEASGQAVPGG